MKTRFSPIKFLTVILLLGVLVLGYWTMAPNTKNVPETLRSTPGLVYTTIPAPTPSFTLKQTLPTTPFETTVVPTITGSKIEPKTQITASENKSIAVEVDYRKYKDWFMNHNLHIRAYTPLEYVCGQYTADMINDSQKAGFHAYFAAVRFTDGTGHALVSFKSTFSGFTSWYFFEPQTNDLLTPEILAKVLNENMGLKVNEVTIYGYFDDAGDSDPTSWRFAYPLYNKKY